VSDETGMKAPTLFTTMYMHAAPQDAVLASMRRTGAIGRFWQPRTRAMQDRACGLRRIPIPRTRVNKGKKRKGRSLDKPRSSALTYVWLPG
jgi:hypothetical protein